MALDLNQLIASTASAQSQMQFQERMSNTAHQREVADLKAAGLNPVLSAGGNGASTPEGASGDYGAVLGMLAQSMNNNAKAMSSLGSSSVKAIEALKTSLQNGIGSAKEEYEWNRERDAKSYDQEHQAFLGMKFLGVPIGVIIDNIAKEEGYKDGQELMQDVFYDWDSVLNRRAGNKMQAGLTRGLQSAKELSKKSKNRYSVSYSNTGNSHRGY